LPGQPPQGRRLEARDAAVRGIVPADVYGYDEAGLLLLEIVNSERQYASPKGPATFELAFRVSRFRPVRSTSIEVFRKMLVPAAAPKAWPRPSVPVAPVTAQSRQAADDAAWGLTEQLPAPVASSSNWWDEAETEAFRRAWATNA
jgi:hypothetical protein